MRSIRNVNTTDYLGTPTAEAQIGKMREPSTGGYTVIEPDLAFDLQVKREMEEEEAKQPPKRYFQRGFAKGGVTRADGCCQRGKTRGRMV